MKEKYVVLILIIIFGSLSVILFKNNSNLIKEEFKPNFTFPFYKEEKQEEYLDYKNKTGLSLKESIIRVNIGLNHPFYTNTKETIDKGILTLVNKYNYISKDYIPNNLITINNLTINNLCIKNHKYTLLAHNIPSPFLNNTKNNLQNGYILLYHFNEKNYFGNYLSQE